jgi:ABC-2 type transport system ATP-binding protein
LLVADDLGKDFREGFLMRRKTALSSLSFALPPGKVLGFLGPNGAGKSTTIHLLLGFLFPSRGRVLIRGRSPMDPGSRRSLGFLPEVFAFDRFSTGRTLLRRFDALSGQGLHGREQRVEVALQAVDLESAAENRVGSYSKGMTQRIGLAQALLGDPEILILDEPMSGMDPSTRLAVRDILIGRRERGKTTLFSTHILTDVEAVADSVLILDRGRVVAEGALDTFGSEAVGSTIVFQDETADRFDSFLLEMAVKREPIAGSSGLQRIIVADPMAQDRILANLAGNGAHIVSVSRARPSLETVFLRVTSRGEVE